MDGCLSARCKAFNASKPAVPDPRKSDITRAATIADLFTYRPSRESTMKRILIILGLLIGSGVRPAHAQNQPAGGAPGGGPPPAPGEISGVVMDTAAKAPIPR